VPDLWHNRAETHGSSHSGSRFGDYAGNWAAELDMEDLEDTAALVY